MLYVKAFHIIFMVAWFAGIFYLPRLFVYHAMTNDQISLERFKAMERKLFFGIATPSGILTTIFGFWFMHYNATYYLHSGWFHAKLACVIVLWLYHIYCGYLFFQFKHDRNKHGHVFYRWLNEFPVLLLIAIVILVVVKPF